MRRDRRYRPQLESLEPIRSTADLAGTLAGDAFVMPTEMPTEGTYPSDDPAPTDDGAFGSTYPISTGEVVEYPYVIGEILINFPGWVGFEAGIYYETGEVTF